MTEPDHLTDLAARLAANVHRVPPHRRLQARRHLERAESLVPALSPAEQQIGDGTQQPERQADGGTPEDCLAEHLAAVSAGDLEDPVGQGLGGGVNDVSEHPTTVRTTSDSEHGLTAPPQQGAA